MCAPTLLPGGDYRQTLNKASKEDETRRINVTNETSNTCLSLPSIEYHCSNVHTDLASTNLLVHCAYVSRYKYTVRIVYVHTIDPLTVVFSHQEELYGVFI